MNTEKMVKELKKIMREKGVSLLEAQIKLTHELMDAVEYAVDSIQHELS